MTIDYIGFAYAATVAAGGAMGYAKARSIPSLAAGLTFGALLGFGAHLNGMEPPKPLTQLGTSVLLAGMMGVRWSRSKKLMPAGLICIISCMAAARNLVVYHRHLPLLGGQ